MKQLDCWIRVHPCPSVAKSALLLRGDLPEVSGWFEKLDQGTTDGHGCTRIGYEWCSLAVHWWSASSERRRAHAELRSVSRAISSASATVRPCATRPGSRGMGASRGVGRKERPRPDRGAAAEMAEKSIKALDKKNCQ